MSLTFNTPRYSELRFERTKIPIVNGIGSTEYDLFRAHKPRSDLLVTIMHGWLGSETLRHVAQEVAHDGFDVALVDHGRPRLSDVLHPNDARSKVGHSVIKHASITTKKPNVIVWDHSNGHRDTTAMVEHQKGKSDDEVTYKIRGVAATASLGTNGKGINLFALPREIAGHGHLLTHHPREEVRALGLSVRNFAKNPLLAAVEGVGALRYVSSLRAGGDNDGVVVEETYLIDDYVIEMPDDTSEAYVLPGSHLTPVIDPDIARIAIARLAAEVESIL